MNSQRWIIAIVVVVVLALGGWFIFAKPGSPSASPSPSETPMSSMSTAPQSSSSASGPAAAASTSSVTIQGFAFSPAAITVKKGTKVTWTNQDTTGHNVQETDSQTGPNSSLLNKGQSYSFTFDTAGTFHYHCSIHPNMTGTVTVTE